MTRPAVLIVGDEVRLARTIELYLGQRGFTVRIASNGQEALERIAEAVPDVIVTDVMMPVMDGYALCRRLRADSATGAIPFLFLTARDHERDRGRDLEMGPAEYLAKPCDLAELYACVYALMVSRSAGSVVSQATEK